MRSLGSTRFPDCQGASLISTLPPILSCRPLNWKVILRNSNKGRSFSHRKNNMDVTNDDVFPIIYKSVANPADPKYNRFSPRELDMSMDN